MKTRFLFLSVLLCCLHFLCADAQQVTENEYEFNIEQVYSEINSKPANDTPVEAWWDRYVIQPQRAESKALGVSLRTLLYLATQYSKEIEIAGMDPVIVETEITAADSAFDWTRFARSSWDDTSDPVGNQLTAGGTIDRFNDHRFQALGGLRRRNRNGTQFQISQQVGWQNNNSTFLTPQNQATSQLRASYTIPLLRGRGYGYNNSVVVLACLENEVAYQDFRARIQDHLLEVVRGYWSLYLERAVAAQRVRLYLKTRELAAILKTRQKIDAQQSQYVAASAALENRRAELIRAQVSVKNAETRLRALVNAPELQEADLIEMIPTEIPSMGRFQSELEDEISTAFDKRPEVAAAEKHVAAGALRLDVANHELKPQLNLITEGYLSGLRGDSDFGGSLIDQVSEDAPGYSAGLQFEVPIGNRQARSRVARRNAQLRKLQLQYEQSRQSIRTEVNIAFRELQTTWREVHAKHRALEAARAEAKTIEVRWSRVVDGSGNASLNLESLLRAQERVTDAEFDFARSLMTYNLSILNLQRANGTFLERQSIAIEKHFEPEGTRYAVNNGNYMLKEHLNAAEWGNEAAVENLVDPIYENPQETIETREIDPLNSQPEPPPQVNPHGFKQLDPAKPAKVAPKVFRLTDAIVRKGDVRKDSSVAPVSWDEEIENVPQWRHPEVSDEKYRFKPLPRIEKQ